MAQTEIWKWIGGYPNYSVSNMGRIRARCWIAKRFAHSYIRGGHFLCNSVNKQGYVRVTLYAFDGKRTSKMLPIHRLVASAFIENTERKQFVNHINGIKGDNRVDNLEWCSRKENQQHAVLNGFYKPRKGEKCHYAKLSDGDVVEIKQLRYCFNTSSRELAKKYKVSVTTINRIFSKSNWKHIPDFKTN